MRTYLINLWCSRIQNTHPYGEALLEPFVLLIHTLMVKHWLLPCGNNSQTDWLPARRTLEVLKLAGRLTPSLLEQRKLWRYTTRDDCVMQHGHELCNHLQERKLKCKNSALSVTHVDKVMCTYIIWHTNTNKIKVLTWTALSKTSYNTCLWTETVLKEFLKNVSASFPSLY